MNVNGNDITIEIGASAKTAAENINAVSTSIKNLKTSSSGSTRGLSAISKQLTALGNAASALNASSTALGTITKLFKTIGNLGQAKITKSLSANISSIANAVKDVSPEALENLDKMASSLQKLSGVDLKGFKDVASQSSVASVQAQMSAATSSHIPSIGGDATKYERELNKIDRAIERTQRKIAQFKQALAIEQATEGGGDAGKVQALNAAIAEQSELLNRLIAQRKELTSGKAKLKIDSSDADKATKKMAGLQKVFSAFKRIAFYRAIRSAIRFVTDGFQEGLQNAYQFSKNVGGPLSSALDNLSSAGFRMKNQLGAAFGQLLVAVTPILLKLIDIVTAAANAITQFFAFLSGQSTYLKATNYWKEWGSAASGAGSAAKEALKYLAPFDELNVLPSASASGGGGGASPTDYENMFEVAEVENPFGKINWASISSDLQSFFYGISDWMKKQDWVKIGNDLWTEIAFAFEEFDFNGISYSFFYLMGVSFASGVQIIEGFVQGVIQKIKEYFQKKIRDENNDGKWSGKEIILGLLRGMLDGVLFIPNWIKENIIKPFVDGILEGFGINANGSAEGEFWGWAIGEGMFRGFMQSNPMGNVILLVYDFIKWIKEILGIHSPSTVFAEIGENIGQGLLNGISEKWQKLRSWFTEKWNSLKTWWSNLSLGQIKIPMPEIYWSKVPAGGWVADVLKALGLPLSVPKLNVKWNARGGIVDGATLIGAGEAGKEAIVPLERNTQWVGMVAGQLADQLGHQNHGRSNVDLADDLEDANGVVVNAIFAATAEIVRAMQRNSTNGQTNQIDIGSVARAVTTWQNNRARAAGI